MVLGLALGGSGWVLDGIWSDLKASGAVPNDGCCVLGSGMRKTQPFTEPTKRQKDNNTA